MVIDVVFMARGPRSRGAFPYLDDSEFAAGGNQFLQKSATVRAHAYSPAPVVEARFETPQCAE